MKKSLSFEIALALISSVILASTHANADTPNAAAAESFKVGTLLCLTGGCAEGGENARRGIELAAEELNAAGGVLGKKVELVTEDSRELEGGGNVISAFQKLYSGGSAHYIIGPTWTVGGLPLAPIVAKKSDVILMSPSLGVASFNEASDAIFNTWPHDDFSTEALAKYALKNGWKKVAVLSNQNPWESAQAKHFSEVFQQHGGTITVLMEPLESVTDLRSEVSKIKRSGADAIFMSTYTQMDIAAKEFQTQNLKLPMMAILLDETRLKNAAGALEGVIYVQYPSPDQSFSAKFEKRYGEKPGISADTAFDALKIIALAIEEAKTFDTNVVKKKLLEVTLHGASGELKFDALGGVKKSPDIYAIKGGVRTRLGSADELLAQ